MDNKLTARIATCNGASWSCLPHSRRCLFPSGAGVVADVRAIVGVVAVVVRAVGGATVLDVSVGAVVGVCADAVLSLGADVLPAVGPVGRAVAVVGVGADAVLGVVVGAVLEAGVGKSSCAGSWNVGALVKMTLVRPRGSGRLRNVGAPVKTCFLRRTRTHKGVGLLRTRA
jgi:hypothetical protein